MMRHRVHSAALNASSEEFLESILSHVPEGEIFDAAEIVAANSQIGNNPSLIVDLAYEEYWRRLQAGQNIDAAQFANRFPGVSEKLLRVIEVGDVIHESPEVFLNLLQPNWPEVPSQIGCYRIIRQIGSGSFSRVYYARDRSFNDREVVLKIARPFQREVETLSQLNHPGIVFPLTRHTDLIPGLDVLVMPFYGRATLADLIRARRSAIDPGGHFDFRSFLENENAEFKLQSTDVFQAPLGPFVQTVIWIGARIAEALGYAHSRNCFHCDIKPANILLRPEGYPIILDFNLAVSDASHSYRGGTVAYICSAQLQSLGAKSTPSGSVDVFSLGVTLIELLQGEVPYPVLESEKEDLSRRASRFGLRESRFKFADRIRKEIGSPLASVLERCVDLDPLERPTAIELAQLLNYLLKGTERRLVERRKLLTVALGATTSLVTLHWMMSSLGQGTADHYQAGIKSLHKNAPSNAARHFSAIISVEPHRKDVRFLLACSLARSGEWGDAAIHLRHLIRKHPLADLRGLLGYVLCRRGRHFELAEQELVKAVDAGLIRIDILNNLVCCRVHLDKLKEANQTIEYAKSLGISSPSLLLNEAFLEGKACRNDGHVPRIEVAEAVLKHPDLARSRDSYRAAIPIYWFIAMKDSRYQQVAIDVIKKGINYGVCRHDFRAYGLDSHPEFREAFGQLKSRYSRRYRPTPANSLGCLMPPPVLQTPELLEFADKVFGAEMTRSVVGEA